jgi:undecaprenyl-diphosphatase
MIIYLNTILLALVQAMTEFLPVSSSGHLILFHNLLDSDILNTLAFDVALHGGSLLAIIIFFYKNIKKAVDNFVINLKNKTLKKDLVLIILISIIPAGLIGLFLEDFIDSFLRKPIIVAGALIFGSILFILVEKLYKPKKELSNVSISNGIFIGIMQCLAFIPGMSRSGITIVAGMNRGLTRTDAARFSFLLAIPLLLGAFIKKTADVLTSTAQFNFYFVLGFFMAFIFSLLAIRILMKLLRAKSALYGFAIYRIILALIIIFLVLN